MRETGVPLIRGRRVPTLATGIGRPRLRPAARHPLISLASGAGVADPAHDVLAVHVVIADGDGVDERHVLTQM